jgi:hypothetical protein
MLFGTGLSVPMDLPLLVCPSAAIPPHATWRSVRTCKEARGRGANPHLL